jgi:hypothetical protein
MKPFFFALLLSKFRRALKRIIWLYLLCFVGNASAQNLYLKISGKTEQETKTIDSIGYNDKHINAKSITDESNSFSEKLSQLGYLEYESEATKKINDSVFSFKLSLGKRTKVIHINIGNNLQLQEILAFDKKNDTIIIPLSETESFLNQTLGKLEKKGYALAKLKLINIKKANHHLEADLQLTLENLRHVNDIVINGYDKFPEGHKHNIKRMYRNTVFNQDNLKKLYGDFEKFRFIKQVKYPEILFAKDSTKIYVYVEKAKANSFDGFIGFSNDENQKIIFNGYVDLTLNNILNTGETFTLYWKSDGKKQKTFNAAIELPYIFKSPFGLKAQLNIFKQDSTFQNTKTAIDLGYFFNYNTRIYLGYQATESSDIQNLNNNSISDFKNAFITTNFEFTDFKPDDFLFPERTKINFKAGLGSRNSKQSNNDQIFFNIDLKHSVYLNEKNSINLRSENYYLNSDQYIINELYRFGGINSIRGFNENSLQANIYTSILTEYRYVFAPGIYVHSIIDYGYFQDKTSNNKGDLLGLGFGFGLLTKNGLFNIVYANGSNSEQTIKLSNSIVHISFKTTF